MSHRNLSNDMKGVAGIVALAGGELVGRTRLQKTSYLLELAGVGDGFSFSYKHYGPFSQELADSTHIAILFGELEEIQRDTAWGGRYSIYMSKNELPETPMAKLEIVKLAKGADPIELELAATAAFLAEQGFDDPWAETAKRKPEKTRHGRIEKAKALYAKFKQIKTPKAWPNI